MMGFAIHRHESAWEKIIANKRSFKRQSYSNEIFKKKESLINDLILHLKQPEKEEKTKLKVSRRKEIIKNRAEINDKDKEKNKKD